MGISLRDIGKVVGIVGQVVPIVKSVVGKKEHRKMSTSPKEEVLESLALTQSKLLALPAGRERAIVQRYLEDAELWMSKVADTDPMPAGLGVEHG